MSVWPPGNGVMARRVREHDWSGTPLGPIENWPQSLKTAVDIVLASGHAMQLTWGAERIVLYNDAYAPMLGGRDPGALGMPLREAWPDVWDEIEPLVSRVFAGETVRFEEMPLVTTRHSYPEETWWNFSYSPVRDEAGAVAGLLNVTVDATPRVRAERTGTTVRESEARFRALVMAGSLSVYRMSPDWRWMYELDSQTLANTPAPIEAWVDKYILPEDLPTVQTAIDKAIRTKSVFELEHRVRVADGGIGWVLSRAVPLLGRDGEIVEWFGAGSDVTERKRAGQALQESEARYHALFTSSPVPFMVLAPNPPDFTVLAANDAYFAASLTSREGLIGRRLFDVFTDDPTRSGLLGSEALALSLDRVLASRRKDEMERVRYDLVVPGGYEPHWWLAINAPMLDASGEVSAIFHQVTRVTELHLAEEADLEGQERQAFLLKLSDAMRPLSEPTAIKSAACRLLGEHLAVNRVFYADADHDHWFVSPGHEVGVEPLPDGPFAMATYGRWIIEDFRAGHRLVIKNMATDGRFSDQDRAAQLALQINAALAVPLVKDGSLVAMLALHDVEARDWTRQELALVEEAAERTWAAVERSLAEKALRDSEMRFREFGENSSDALWIIDAETMQLEYLSPAFERIWGESRQAVMADISRWADLAHPDDRAAASMATPRVLAGETFQADYRIIRPDGEVRWIRDAGFPIREGGVVKRGGGIAQDVTDLKRAEAAVRESEARLRDFGDASQDVLWIRDAELLQWQYLTPAFETIYGQSRVEALSGNNYSSWLGLIVPEDRPHAMENIGRVKAGEQVAFEYRIRRPVDGTIRWLRDTDFPILNEAGEVALIGGIGHDFTELRETETRLQALIEGIPQLVWRAGDPGRWTWASPQWTAFTGQQEVGSRGWGWLEVLYPDDREVARDAWSRAVESGRLEVEYRIRAHGSGPYRWFQSRAVPVRDKAGAIVEWLGTSTDINDLRDLQGRQGVLVAELQHRTRNLITVVKAVSQQTLGNADSLDDFRHRFGDRLSALSRVQGLLSNLSAGQRVTFDELLGSELAALGAPADRVTLDGPADVPLRSATLQTFSLALHELATNALKYGALASAAGHLTVRWRSTASSDGSPRLQVDWRETGVDMTDVGDRPRGGGYGRELIERALPYQLDAETTYDLTPSGVHCTIDVPTPAAQP